MAAEGGDITRYDYTYRGEEGEVIPREATHIFVQARVVRREAFSRHPNIVEVICHDEVEKIEEGAIEMCTSLRKMVMRGVKIVEQEAFYDCTALTDLECDKLEIIEALAFYHCRSLKSINLPSVRVVKQEAFSECDHLNSINLPSIRVVEKMAFDECYHLTNAKLGNKLERIEEGAFGNCDLERITIPLKDGLITNHYNIFQNCSNLNNVDLVEGELHETIAALHMEEWRNDMNEEIESINQTLPNALACYYISDDEESPCEKAQAIRGWIRSVLGKIIHYQDKHQRLLDEDVATTLQLVLPNDIVMDNVLLFLELPSYTFQVGDDDDEEEDDSDEDTQLVELLRIDDRGEEEE